MKDEPRQLFRDPVLQLLSEKEDDSTHEIEQANYAQTAGSPDHVEENGDADEVTIVSSEDETQDKAPQNEGDCSPVQAESQAVDAIAEKPKKRQGRPPGSKNKKKKRHKRAIQEPESPLLPFMSPDSQCEPIDPEVLPPALIGTTEDPPLAVKKAVVAEEEQPVERPYQRKAFELWLKHHQENKLTAQEIDEEVAKVFKNSLFTIRQWKTQFGWVRRRAEAQECVFSEEVLALIRKTEGIESASLEILAKYLSQILASERPIDRSVAISMKEIFDFAKRNKIDMHKLIYGDVSSAVQRVEAVTGVSFTIRND